MILADFKLKPLKGSKFYTRIRIFDTRRAMRRTIYAESSLRGAVKAAFSFFHRETTPASGRMGDIYLHQNPTLCLDAVHELTHAAVHYVREYRRGDLMELNSGNGASESEELLCRAMESYMGGFCIEVAKLEKAAT